MSDDILYHCEIKSGRGKREDRTFVQIVVPLIMTNDIIQIMHSDSIINMHMGITRTINKMRQRFFWKSMYSDIVNYCKRCQSCQQPVKPVVGPTFPQPITQNPWERVHVDIAGEYTTCENSGNKYILGFVDSFTKYVELVPISDMKATTCSCRCLYIKRYLPSWCAKLITFR